MSDENYLDQADRKEFLERIEKLEQKGEIRGSGMNQLLYAIISYSKELSELKDVLQKCGVKWDFRLDELNGRIEMLEKKWLQFGDIPSWKKAHYGMKDRIEELKENLEEFRKRKSYPWDLDEVLLTYNERIEKLEEKGEIRGVGMNQLLYAIISYSKELSELKEKLEGEKEVPVVGSENKEQDHGADCKATDSKPSGKSTDLCKCHHERAYHIDGFGKCDCCRCEFFELSTFIGIPKEKPDREIYARCSECGSLITVNLKTNHIETTPTFDSINKKRVKE